MSSHKNDEIIRELFKKFDLNIELDFFEKFGRNGDLQYRIITRRGIDKIESQSEAKIVWKHVYMSDDMVIVDVVASKEIDGKTVEYHTNGEADRNNVAMKPVYLAAMALSRGKARAVLGIEDFYKHKVYSIDEADEFKQDVESGNTGSGAKIKDGPVDLSSIRR